MTGRRRWATGLAVAALASTAGTASARPASTARPSVSPAGCATRHLHITQREDSAGLEHVGLDLVFTNTGPACTLRGYPGVDGVTARGAVAVHARRTLSGYEGGTTGTATVTLRRGQAASALLEGLGAAVTGKGPCRSYAKLLVTPPGETHAVALPVVAYPICYPEIHPVLAGTRGSQRL